MSCEHWLRSDRLKYRLTQSRVTHFRTRSCPARGVRTGDSAGSARRETDDVRHFKNLFCSVTVDQSSM